MGKDYGVAVSKKGTNVNDFTEIIFSTKYPTAKLDTSKEVSFRNVLLRFISDPPEPDGVTTFQTLTKVASIPHGYSYRPSFWDLIQVVNHPTGTSHQEYFQEIGVISQNTVDDQCAFFINLNSTNINLYVQKDKFSAFGVDNPLTGMIIRIRVYVFAEDLGV